MALPPSPYARSVAANSPGMAAGLLVSSIKRLDLTSRRGPGGLSKARLDQAAEAVEICMIHPAEEPRRALVARGRIDAAFARDFATTLVPAVAARLGVGWAEDRLSFVDVSIASARLQDVLRVVSRVQVPDDAPRIAVVQPPWEQHTLAAVLLVDHLRRRGADARLIAGPSGLFIARSVAQMGAETAFVTVGSRHGCKRAHKIVDALRSDARVPLRVVIGGPGLDDETDRGRADLATCDLNHALGFCRIALGEACGGESLVDA